MHAGGTNPLRSIWIHAPQIGLIMHEKVMIYVFDFILFQFQIHGEHTGAIGEFADSSAVGLAKKIIGEEWEKRVRMDVGNQMLTLNTLVANQSGHDCAVLFLESRNRTIGAYHSTESTDIIGK